MSPRKKPGRHRGRKRSALLGLALVGLLVPTSNAFASTLTSNGENATWTAAGDADSQSAYFEEPNQGVLAIYTADDPVVYTDADNTSTTDNIATDCIDNDGVSDGQASEVLCTGFGTISADSGGGADFLSAEGDFGGDPLHTILATLNGGIGADDLDGGNADPAAGGGDTLNGGQGDDDLDGQDGRDKLNGGADDDNLNGDDGHDEVRGDDGDDAVTGDDDNDLVRGGSGDDYVDGDNGADDVDGDDGSDSTNEHDDGGADKVRGGAGTDFLYYSATSSGSTNDDNLTINENGVADDGDVENDPGNDFGGFENIDFDVHPDARATVATGTDTESNSIDGDGEIDEFTPGPGPDFVSMGDGNDTAHTVDGYPDSVDCGQEQNDTDTANADQFDRLIDCENANITQVTSAYGDPDGTPPSVKFTNPGAGAVLPATPATTLTATATDDAGVDRVVFIDDGTILCTDTAAPYECAYEPAADDVGDNTLSVWAIDNNGQFGANFLEVTVSKFDSPGLEARTNKRDLEGQRKVRASGQLNLPSGVTSAEGCEGDVRIKIEDGSDTIRTRRVALRADCSWSRTVRLPSARTIDEKRVQVFTTVLGNDVLGSERGPMRKMRVR